MRIHLSLLPLLVLFMLVRPAAAGDGSWLTSVDDAVAAARDGDRYILVDLYAEWCGWCKVLESQVFTSAEFRDATAGMVLLRVDVDDGGEGSELQARFDARSLPTTLILDSGLVKVGEIQGYAPTGPFLARIRQQLQEHTTLLELYGKVRRGGDVALQRRLAEDLHGRGDGERAAALYEAVLRQVASGGPEAAWLYYLSADAHRLGGDYSRADVSARRARKMAAGLGDPELAERLDLLRFYIAHDSGDCGEAVASLEQFLDSHPKSGFSSQAKRTLAAIRDGEEMECT
ncbi:MAG: DUF255 domain-containing protein [bacterium]|nr:DUF255 domain-containing protein [bacterium]